MAEIVIPELTPPFPGEKPFTGLTAALKIVDTTTKTAKTIAYISGCDLTLEKEIIEILAFTMEFKEKVPAVKDWSVSIDGTVSISSTGSQKEFYEAFNKATLLTLGIFLDESTYFVGTGYVASFNISAAPDSAITLTSEIAGSGATILTIPAVTP